tara:strand:- start:3114 stop:4796 length:1683 start_codon:yes stop_codon:yes gene_type:complete
MSVLGRKLFNKGGQVSSRGVGITSGLVPVQKFQEGGRVSKLEALSPALLDLGGRLLAGRSLQGGVGGGLDIAGQALSGSAPSFAAGLQTYRAGQQSGDPNFDFKVVGNQLIKINKTTGETEVVEKSEDTGPEFITTRPGEVITRIEDGKAEKIFENVKAIDSNKLYTLSTNQKLVTEDGVEIARGLENKSNSLFRLSKGQKAYDSTGKEIAFFPDDEAQGEVIKLSKGQKAYDDTGKVIASNETEDNKIIKLSPGQSAFDLQGNVIASLPKEEVKKLEYFKLSPGQILFDEKGEIIAKAPSIKDDVEKFHGGKTKDERLLIELAQYESKAGFNTDGSVNLDNLTPGEKTEYLRILPLVDEIAKEEGKNWETTKMKLLDDFTFVTAMGESIRMAKQQFEQNPATGAVRGRLSPLFNVLQDVTGVSIPKLVNDTFGKDILLEELTGNELVRLQSDIALNFQRVMKGQVNTFEQQLILNSLFSVVQNPESADLAFENLTYLNDLRKQMILEAQKANNSSEYIQNVDKWKAENKPDMLKTKNESIQSLEEKYGIDLTPTEGETF